jgi:TatD DNase family protein
MKIDIHRHAKDPGTAKRVIRNLFHDQSPDVNSKQYYSIGLHPWHVNASSLDEDIRRVKEVAKNKQVIAIGETGLDKSIKVPYDIQVKAFSAQIEIAAEFNKPVIIHCVKAYNEIFSLRISSKIMAPWIIHWFNASREMGEQLISKNFYLSFGHMLFNKKSKAYNAFTKLPEDRIFFETDDAGYTIDEVYEQAALLRELNITKLEKQIETNFVSCFGIQP